MMFPGFTIYQVAALFFETHPNSQFVSGYTLGKIASKCARTGWWYNCDIQECAYDDPDIFKSRTINGYVCLERNKDMSKMLSVCSCLRCDDFVELKKAAADCETMKITIELEI